MNPVNLLPVPSSEELKEFLSLKLLEAQEAINALINVYEKLYTATDKPRDGNIVYADGANFDPSSLGFGEGYYFYALAQYFPMFNVGIRRVTIFISGGTYTKPSWLRTALVLCQGGGGGGGDYGTGTSGAGGSSGALGVKLLLAGAISATETVTVGTGGAGGTTPANGNNTSFGSLCVGNGGAAGANYLAQPVPTGGTGDIIIPGAPGGPGDIASGVLIGGSGGGSGGGVANAPGSASTAGVKGGGGAGGSYNSTGPTGTHGTAGGDGFVIVFEF